VSSVKLDPMSRRWSSPVLCPARTGAGLRVRFRPAFCLFCFLTLSSSPSFTTEDSAIFTFYPPFGQVFSRGKWSSRAILRGLYCFTFFCSFSAISREPIPYNPLLFRLFPFFVPFPLSTRYRGATRRLPFFTAVLLFVQRDGYRVSTLQLATSLVTPRFRSR